MKEKEEKDGKGWYFLKLLLTSQSVAITLAMIIILGFFSYSKLIFPYLSSIGFTGGWQFFAISVLGSFMLVTFCVWCTVVNDYYSGKSNDDY